MFQDGETFTPDRLRYGIGLFDDEAPMPRRPQGRG